MPRRPHKRPRFNNGDAAFKKTTEQARPGNVKLKKWVKRNDIEGDEVDKFHSARDRILLEGDESDFSDGEEEVFGLDLDEEESVDEAEEEDEDVDTDPAGDRGSDERLLPRKKSSLRRESSTSGSESEEFESWGRAKSAYYASNAALLADKEGEEDEEEANEMEEREARRIQARMRDDMADEDFGLDDAAERTNEKAILDVDEFASEPNGFSTLLTPGVHADKAVVLRHLEKTSPETLALAREWDDVARDLVRAQNRLDKLDSAIDESLALGLSHLHHQTLLTYVSTLAFYLHLRATIPTKTPQTQQSLRIKPVLERLLTLKRSLLTMEDLDVDSEDEDESDDDISDFDEEELNELSQLVGRNHTLGDDMSSIWGRGKSRLEEGELEELLKDAEMATEDQERPKKRPKHAKGASLKSNADRNVTVIGKDANGMEFDLIEPEFIHARSSTRTADDGMEEYGEPTALSTSDKADKTARKRALRFHTNKIEMSARKKEAARNRMAGDNDIPYRERKKEKEARVRQEVERARKKDGEDLDPEGETGADEDPDVLDPGKHEGDGSEGSDSKPEEDGYYELVKRNKRAKKEAKKQQYDNAKLAQRLDIEADAHSDGQRSLTRAILKNKGLTPRRSKAVRNPRVKKREQFEKARRKVRSQKAIYKGGLAGKPYGGEESGITKVVKSVRF